MNVDDNGFPVNIPFLKLLSMRCLKVVDDEDMVGLALETEHMNGQEMAHSSVTMTMLDVTVAITGRSADAHGRGVMAIEMKTASMRLGRGTLEVSTHYVHQSTTMTSREGEVHDVDGSLVARDSDTFEFVRRIPPPRTPEPGAGD